MVAGGAAGVAGVASLIVMQKSFHLAGGNSIIWAVPCFFVGFLIYNWLKPDDSD
jgi:hypothetical protein